MLISEAVEAVTSAMAELNVDPAIVEETHQALAEVVSLLQTDNFEYMGTIQQESFGANPVATSLSYHHGRAHQVMTDTLNGVAEELAAFATNIKKAADLLTTTDDTAGQDLKKTHGLVASLDYLDRHSSGDQAYNHSRNHPRNPFGNGNGGTH